MIIKDNIKDILKKGTFNGNMYFLPKIQLDRKDYIECNSVLEVLGLKWNKGKKAHILTEEIEDLEETLNDILESGEVETIKEYKKRFQAFYTPKEVAEYLVELADINNTDNVLEPSAGLGNIVDEILPKIKDGAKYNNIVLIELDIEKVKQLKEKYDCYGGMKDFETGIGTYSLKHKMNIYTGDFLESKLNDNAFDKIIMNPPFAKSQDVKHILKAYSLLNNGGRIVSVASSSIQTRQGKLYDDLKALNPEFIDLDKGSFKESNTMVNTCIVILNKSL